MTKLIEVLIKEGILNKDSLISYISKNSKTHVSIGALIDSGLLEKEEFYSFLLKSIRKGVFSFDIVETLEQEGIDTIELYKYIANALHIEYVDLNDKEIDSSVLDRIPTSLLLKNRAIVVDEDELHVLVVFADPFDLAAQDALNRFFPKKIVKIGLSQASIIKEKLIQIETYESLKSYVEEIKKDLNTNIDADDNESPAVLK